MYILMTQSGLYYQKTMPNGYRVYTKDCNLACKFTHYAQAFNSAILGDRVKEI